MNLTRTFTKQWGGASKNQSINKLGSVSRKMTVLMQADDDERESLADGDDD